MTLLDFRTLIRLAVPSAKTSVITDATLDVLINKGVDEVNFYVGAYQSNEKFNVTADTDEYSLASLLSSFVRIDSSGLWWNSGTAGTPVWNKLDPITRHALDIHYPTWRQDSSGDPLRYLIESDTITLHPTPDTTLASGLWAHFIQEATAMTLSTHYPFTGSTTEYLPFKVLDDAIMDYVRWKLSSPLGNDQKGVLTQQEFKTNLAERAILLKERLDLTASPDNRMRGPSIGKS